jgi:hypothetical protein
MAGLLGGMTAGVASEATMVMTCYSLSMPAASTTVGAEDLKLEFTNEAADEINNEWFLGGGTSEISSLLVFTFGETQASAYATLRIPNAGDLDFNLLTDFFEVAKSVENAQTTGEFELDDGMDVYPGTLKASWNRAADSASGTCKIQLSIPDFGLINATFNHTFEILQFKGPITYSVTGTNVDASVKLLRQGASGEFEGPWPLYQYSRAELGWKAADWSGPGGFQFQVLANDALADVPFSLLRAGNRTSDLYLGAFFLDDGDPTTPFTDEYDLWEVVIIDPNDSNSNDIPDLSDIPVNVVPGDPPKLSVRMVGDRLQLKIEGKTGQSVTLEQRTTLGAGAWTTAQTVVLTADVQEFDLGIPAATVFFIRAKL